VQSSWNTGVKLKPEQDRSTLNATMYMSEEQFMKTLGLKLVAGREFEPGEYRDFSELGKTGACIDVRVVIIPRKLAETLFPGESAVGKNIYIWNDNPTRIVGIVDHLVRPSMQGRPGGARIQHDFSVAPSL
jgi:putative ABC transport system permease protein